MDIIPPYQPLHRAILTGQSARAIQRIIRTDRTSSAKSIITKHSILVHYQPQHRTLSDDEDEEDEEMVGETALHLLVYKILYDERMDMSIGAFHDLVKAFPEASGVLDGEGDSPFSLTLTCPRLLPHCHYGNSYHHHHDDGGSSTRVSTQQQQQEQQADDKREQLILTMIQTMINANPTITYQCGNDEWDNNALHHALMCHRHTTIIRTLLKQNPHTLVNANFRGELPLHVACKSKSPCQVIEALVGVYPEGCGVQDTQGLTPLHWAWIRHVAGPGEEGHVVPDNYEELMFEADHCIHEEEEGGIAEFRHGFLGRNGGLFWDTTEVLLRAAAAANLVVVDHHHEEEYQIPSWRIVHIAASIHCPRAVLRIAIKLHPHQLRERDENGKLPLHLAAAASSSSLHHATTTNTIQPWIFRGVFGQPLGPQILEEDVMDCLLRNCPEAARIADYEFRLPLHIAIDTEKKLLHAAAVNAKENYHHCADAALNVRTILTAYPEAIRRKDGLSRLYPFMLAAVHSTHHHHQQQQHQDDTTNHTNQSVPTTPPHQNDTTMHQERTMENPPNHSSHKTQLSTNQDVDQGTTVLQQSEEADINMDEVQSLLNSDNQSIDGMSDIFISNQFPLEFDSCSQQEQPQQQQSVSSDDDDLDDDSLSSSSTSSSSTVSRNACHACQPANKDNTTSSLNNTNDAVCNLSTIYELFRACPDFVRDITSKHDTTIKHKFKNHHHIPKSKKPKYENPLF